MIFNLNIGSTLQLLLDQEDTDSDKKITVEDNGPKQFELTSTSGENCTITGTYHLSNLLQELILAKKHRTQDGNHSTVQN